MDISSIRVLHVDDDPSLLELTGEFLEREDDRLVLETATSAGEGLDQIGDRPPDCIVSDYDMPGKNGIEFLRAVRETYPHLPFILFTGKGSESVASDAIAAGVTDYLQKGSGTEQYELLANRITNAVQAQRATQEATRQEELMRLTEFAGDTGGWELDLETEELKLTDGTRRLMNLSQDDSLGLEEAIDLYHPDDRDEVRAALDQAAETGEQVQGTWRVRPKDGEQRLLDVTVTPVRSNGDITTLRGAVNDTTERYERRQELESERRFIKQSLNALDDLFYVLDTDGTIQQWNDRVIDVTGYTESELDGMDATEIFPEDEQEEIGNAISQTLADDQGSVEADLHTADGDRIPYEWTGARLTDADGTTTGIVGIGRDLSERRQRERRFRALVEESNDVISIIDADGRFQYQSPSLERILGYDLEETVGDLAWEYVHPDDREAVMDTFEEWLAGPEGRESVEYRARRADGSWRWFEARASKQFDNPAVEGYVVNSRDVTARKERERELRDLNETAQRLSRARSRAEIAEIGTEAARDILGLQANSLHFATEDRTELIPAAQTEESVSLIGDAPTLPVEDSIAGRVYRDSEPTAIEDVRQSPDAYDPDTSLRGHLYLPLADHGVLVAGSPAVAAFEDTDITVGELLAGNLVAALDRIDQTETAQKRREQLSLFFEESPLGAIQWDDSFRFDRINERAQEILGYSEADLRGEPWELIVADADRDKVENAVEQLLEADGGTHVINENITQSGKVRTYEWHNRAVTGSDGEVRSIFSKFYDVTERERRKQQLEEYETVLKALSDAVYVLDEDGQFTYVNDEFVELVGYNRETIVGNTPSLIKDEEAVGTAERQLGRLLSEEGPETVTFEVTIQPRDGNPIICEDHMCVLPYDGDQFNGSVGTLRDITDRKGREQELQVLKSQYETLAENFPDGAVYLIDTDLRFERARGEELRRVDLSPNDFKGKKPHTLFPEEIADELCHYLEKALDGHANTFEQEYRGERYRLQAVPVRTNGEEITHVMGVSQNITEYTEDKHNLERQNERLQEFASVVSHDLRNPLQTADGRLELAQVDCDSAHLDDVAGALDRMDALIEDLLTLARSGETVGNTEAVSLSSLIEKCWEVVPSENAALTVETDQTISADRSRLQQLLENLFANAVEHGGKDVTVRVGELEEGFYVADDGVGIPAEERVDIFEAGYSTAEEGTGFGLRIAKQVVEAHGWDIRVTDSDDGGAQFEITGTDTPE